MVALHLWNQGFHYTFLHFFWWIFINKSVCGVKPHILQLWNLHLVHPQNKKPAYFSPCNFQLVKLKYKKTKPKTLKYLIVPFWVILILFGSSMCCSNNYRVETSGAKPHLFSMIMPQFESSYSSLIRGSLTAQVFYPFPHFFFFFFPLTWNISKSQREEVLVEGQSKSEFLIRLWAVSSKARGILSDVRLPLHFKHRECSWPRLIKVGLGSSKVGWQIMSCARRSQSPWDSRDSNSPGKW